MGTLSILPDPDSKKMERILHTKRVAIMRAAVKGVNFAADLFTGDIMEKQMSGRKSPTYGLNRRSGFAAKGWRKVTFVTPNQSIEHRVFNIMKYTKYHEFETMAPNIPKRLHVREYFKTEGVKIYHREISDALKEMA